MKTLVLSALLAVVGVAVGQAPGCRFDVPNGFQFSAATSAYQVEGGAYEDGKGTSIWDIWTKNPFVARDSGNTSCDSYHQYKEDVKALKYLGVQRYRFSISWTRILPFGTKDVVNPAGIAYYNKLINELLANGIQPQITMYHWDLPEALQVQGGWLNRQIVDWFGDYADVLYKNFGDRVKHWLTLNEPIITSTYAYCGRPSISAPGNFSNVCPWTKYLSAHHQILAHATAYDVYNKKYRLFQQGEVGIVLATGWFESTSQSADDVAAASRAREFSLGWFANPIFHGDYPAVFKQYIAARSAAEGEMRSRLPEFTASDKFLLKGGLYGLLNGGKSADILGLNYYYAFNVSVRTDFSNSFYMALEELDGGFRRYLLQPYPVGIRKLLTFASSYYDTKVIITENGLGLPDVASPPFPADSLNDPLRIQYIQAHLVEVLKAVQDGARVVGYTVWSLIDNLEWSSGFHQKFGLFQVDFNSPSKTRTKKASADWYKQVIAQKWVDACTIPQQEQI